MTDPSKLPDEIEAAIAVIFDDMDHDCTCRKAEADADHSSGKRGSPGEPEDCDCRVSRNLDALRAVIAATIEYAAATGKSGVPRATNAIIADAEDPPRVASGLAAALRGLQGRP